MRGVGEGPAFADPAISPGLVEGLDAGVGDIDEEGSRWFGAPADELGVQLLGQAVARHFGQTIGSERWKVSSAAWAGEVLAPPFPFVDGGGAVGVPAGSSQAAPVVDERRAPLRIVEFVGLGVPTGAKRGVRWFSVITRGRRARVPHLQDR